MLNPGSPAMHGASGVLITHDGGWSQGGLVAGMADCGHQLGYRSQIASVLNYCFIALMYFVGSGTVRLSDQSNCGFQRLLHKVPRRLQRHQ